MIQKPKRRFQAAKRHHSQNRTPWVSNAGGIFNQHDFSATLPDDLSWWEDFWFLFGKRRIQVWWQHPRMVYAERLEDMAYKLLEKEKPTLKGEFVDSSRPNWKRVGKGLRKKAVSYTLNLDPRWRTFHDRWAALEEDLSGQDHGWQISASGNSKPLLRAQGLDLVFPVEVRSEADLLPLRHIAEQYLRGDRTMLHAAPVYTFSDWQRDREILRQQKETRAAKPRRLEENL